MLEEVIVIGNEFIYMIWREGSCMCRTGADISSAPVLSIYEPAIMQALYL